MLHNIDDLEGALLAWAFIKASGFTAHRTATGYAYLDDQNREIHPHFDDTETLRIMKAHRIGLDRPLAGQNPPRWRAIADFQGLRRGKNEVLYVVTSYAEEANPNLGVVRCFIKSLHGEAIDVPQDVVESLASVA